MPSWWVAREWEESPVFLISHVFWVIFAIVLHELAHGIVAIWCGDDTPRETGHMTWNPLVHMGQNSLIMFAICGIAWGLMPINPTRFRHRYDQALVSFAGPAMNLLLFAVCVAGTVASIVYKDRIGEPLGPNLFVFWFVGACFNLTLAMFNMLPVPPLDGSAILSNLVPAYRRTMQRPESMALSMALFIGVFLFAGSVISEWSAQATIFCVNGGKSLLGVR